MCLHDLGEFELIERLAAQGVVRPADVLCGIGDDCAVLDERNGEALLVTTDTMVEGVHFRLGDAAPEGVGFKLLAISLSDVAAMGGRGRDAVVAVSAPGDFDVACLQRVYDGLFACGERFGVNIVGGDTTQTKGPAVFSLTLIGRAPADNITYRSSAQPGDIVWVSGTLGDAAAGLRLTQSQGRPDDADRRFLLRRFYRPEPRVDLGPSVASSPQRGAMIDLSDGISSDLRHVADRSGVDIEVDLAALPMSDALRRFADQAGTDPLELALSGGEDYELAWTTRPEWSPDGVFGSAFCAVGRVKKGDGKLWGKSESGIKIIENKGFVHFR